MATTTIVAPFFSFRLSFQTTNIAESLAIDFEVLAQTRPLVYLLTIGQQRHIS